MKRTIYTCINFICIGIVGLIATSGLTSCKPAEQPIHIKIPYDTVYFTESSGGNLLRLSSDSEKPCLVYFDTYPSWASPNEPTMTVQSPYNSDVRIIFNSEGLSQGEHFGKLTFHTKYENLSVTLMGIIIDTSEYQVPKRIVFPSGIDDATLTFYNPTSIKQAFDVGYGYYYGLTPQECIGHIGPKQTKVFNLHIDRETFYSDYDHIELSIGLENFVIEVVVEE